LLRSNWNSAASTLPGAVAAAVLAAPVALVVTALVTAGTLIAQLFLWRVMRRLNAEQSLRQRDVDGKLQALQRVRCFQRALTCGERGQNSHTGLQVLPGAHAFSAASKHGPRLAMIEAGASTRVVRRLCVNVEEITVLKGFYDDFGEPAAQDVRAAGSANIAGKRALFAARACMQ
jgi:hypothetical protein